jgi:hypothetical protein
MPDTGDERKCGNLDGRGTNGVIISLPGLDTFNPSQCWLSRKKSRALWTLLRSAPKIVLP